MYGIVSNLIIVCITFSVYVLHVAVSPSDYSWVSFALSVAIGGTAVFLVVGSVVIVRALHFRSRQFKRESSKKHQHHHDEGTGKNSSGNSHTHERQFESKDGISVDDKDPDIIPSNMGSYFIEYSLRSETLILSRVKTIGKQIL